MKAVMVAAHKTKEKNMQSQFLTMNETVDRCEEALQSNFCDLRNELLRAESLRTMALASLQRIQTELNLKRARPSGSSTMCMSMPTLRCKGPRFG